MWSKSPRVRRANLRRRKTKRKQKFKRDKKTYHGINDYSIKNVILASYQLLAKLPSWLFGLVRFTWYAISFWCILKFFGSLKCSNLLSQTYSKAQFEHAKSSLLFRKSEIPYRNMQRELNFDWTTLTTNLLELGQIMDPLEGSSVYWAKHWCGNVFSHLGRHMWPVWPDWAIYWTLANFSKSMATISLLKSPTFLGNFCKDVKILHFSSKHFWATFIDIWQFFLVTACDGQPSWIWTQTSCN